MAAKVQTKKERKAFSTGSVAARLATGQKVGPLRDNNYKAILGPDGKKVAQVSDRASGAVLEGLPSEVEAQASKVLKESGKGGTGRYVVNEGDVDKARDLILAAHKARAEQIKAKQTTVVAHLNRLKAEAKFAAESKPSGKRARSRGVPAKRGAVKVA